MSNATMLDHTDGFARPFGWLPSPAGGRGAGGEGTAYQAPPCRITPTASLDVAACCTTPLLPHEGRGSQDTSVCVHLGVARGSGR